MSHKLAYSELDDPFLRGFVDELMASGMSKEAAFEFLKPLKALFKGAPKKPVSKLTGAQYNAMKRAPAPAATPEPRKMVEKFVFPHEEKVVRRMERHRDLGRSQA